MKNTISVIKFTIYDLVIKKSFWVMNIFILVILLLITNVNNIINLFKDDENLVLIIDNDNVYEDNLEVINNYDLDKDFIVNNDSITKSEISDYLESEKYSYIIQIENVNDNIDFTVFTKKAYSGEGTYEINILENLYTEIKIANLNLSVEEIKSINPEFTINFESLSDNENMSYSNYMIATFISIILFYAIYFYAIQVSTSVTTEKTSKIVEILLTSTDANSIILGKTIGLGLIGIIQILSFSLIGMFLAYIFMPSEVVLLILSEVNFSPLLIFIVIVYFVLGYLLYSFMFALTGATVSRVEDIQTANGPVSIIAVISFYASFFTMSNPENIINIVAKYVPFSSPFLMPISFINGNSNIEDIVISLVILIFTVMLIAFISIKIYKNAILNNGSKLTLKSLFKTFKEIN